jgi:hypothetical protein
MKLWKTNHIKSTADSGMLAKLETRKERRTENFLEKRAKGHLDRENCKHRDSEARLFYLLID